MMTTKRGRLFLLSLCILFLSSCWVPTLPEFHKVIFDANGGTGSMSPQIIASGEAAALKPNAFSNTGFAFLGWASLPEGPLSHEDGAEFTMGSADLTLWAQWGEQSSLVLFDPNGASGSMAPQYIPTGTEAALNPNRFAREYHDFLGWGTDPDGTPLWSDRESFTMDSGGLVTLYAIWIPQASLVIFNANGGTGTMPFQEIPAGTSAALRYNAFSRSGYYFSGWATLPAGSPAYHDGASIFMGPSGLTLYAVWTAAYYNVFFSSNGGNGYMDPQPIQYGMGASLNPNAFTRDGFYFAGWSDTSSGPVLWADGALATMNTYGMNLYAVWSSVELELTFDPQGGMGSMPNQLIPAWGTELLDACAFTRTGHLFGGWSSTAGGSISWADGASYMMQDSPATIYAVWNPLPYPVVFNSGGGSGSMADQYITFGTSVGLNTCSFTRLGHSFSGWSVVENGMAVYLENASYTMSTEGATLYAVWTPKDCSVTFNANGGTGTMAPQSIVFGTSEALDPSAFTRMGYTFSGWSMVANGSVDYPNGASYTMTTDGATLHAVWTPKDCYVTFDANGGTGFMAPQAIVFGTSEALDPSAFTLAGYEFSGWSTVVNGAVDYPNVASYTMSTDGATLWAVWTPSITYTLSYLAGYGGTISGLTPQTVTAGADGTPVTAVANPGYMFSIWNDGVTSATRQELAVTADKGVVAIFAQQTLNLSYLAGPGGSLSGATSQTVFYGSNGTSVTATGSPGYHFVEWSDSSTQNPRADLAVTSGISVSALFAINMYQLEYLASGNGSIVGTSTQLIAHGADADTVFAAPSAGHWFAGWSDGLMTPSRTDTFVVADLSVTALFYPEGASVIFEGPADETIDISEDSGQSLSISANDSMLIEIGGTWDTYEWFVNGSNQWISSSSMIFYASWYSMGVHNVTVIVTSGGVPYSKQLFVRVVN